MKIFKMLFSRIFLFVLSLLFQLALFLIILYYFNTYYAAFQLVFNILSLLVFLYLINRKECPEFKIPWLVILLLSPFFGMILYLMFSHIHVPHYAKKKLTDIKYKGQDTLKKTEEEEKELEETLGDYAGLEKYLHNTSLLPGHLHNKVTYFKIGELFFEDLLVELEKATSFIFMEYFIIDPGKMWNAIHDVLLRKVKEGVEVYVLYDDFGTFGMIKGNYYKQLQKEGIHCYKFNPVRPIVSGIYNNRDHRKITVIDGKVGYTGGVNLGDEYINENKRLGHWKDTAIKIEGSAINNLSLMFMQTFEVVSRKNIDYDKYLNKNLTKYDEEGAIVPFGDGPEPFYPEQVGENNYINIIQSAKHSLIITTPYLIIDHNMATALRNAAFRGVDVKIITPHIPDKKIILTMTRSNYPYLLEAGVKIYEYTPGFIHAKTCICDDVLGFVGTINLDYRSLVHHYECGALLYKNPCLKDIRKDLEETVAVSQEITKKNFPINAFSVLISNVLNLFSSLL